MGRKTASRGARKYRVGAKRVEGKAPEKPVALTLKVDSELYLRLNTLRATQRRTNQDILEQALKEYLTRAGA
jgi:Ribbon-helix-helix protein, copG family